MQQASYPPATLLRRLCAMTYDGLLLAALFILAGSMAVLLNGGEAINSGNPLFQLWLLGVPGLFFCWFWVHGGQTLGMRAWRMRLVTDQGAGLGWMRALSRLPLALCSWLSVIGLLWCLIDTRGRAAHDILGGCMIVVEPRN